MEINFGKDEITWSEGENEIKVLLNGLDPSQLINLLERCVSSEADLIFVESEDISPFSKKLKELIESALSKSST